MGKNIRYNENGRDFEWDEDKNAKNQEKHRISFEDSTMAFNDESGVEIFSEGSLKNYGEKRWVLVGAIFGALISVVYTLRKSIIRIISARPSNKKEKKIYRERNKK